MALTLNGSTGITSANIADGTIAAGDLAANVARTNFGAGAVLQVVSAEFTSEFTTTSTSLVDSGFSASITPSSSSNKVLIFITASFLRVQGTSGHSEGAGIAIANGAGTILYDSMRDGGGVLDDWTETSGSAVRGATITKQMLHSPNTTSSYTYKIYCAQREGGTLKLNYATSSKAVITLMEIAG